MAGSPFLSIEEFTSEYQGALSDGESTTASRLLAVVSDYIRSVKPDVDTDAAAQVVFEVVRDAMLYGPYERLSQFDNETSRRKESGTLSDRADLLTSKQKVILAILAGGNVGARGSFTLGDY